MLDTLLVAKKPKRARFALKMDNPKYLKNTYYRLFFLNGKFHYVTNKLLYL